MKSLLLSLTALVAPVASFAMVNVAHAALPTPPAILEWKSTVRGWENSYYWYEQDARYAFTSKSSYQSWFPGNPTGVSPATIPELAPVPLEGAVFHRPGARLIQFESSPNVYAVSRYGVLRHIATEQVAFELYGAEWTTYVDTVAVTDYPLYTFGASITDSAEYDPEAYQNVTNPSVNAVNAETRPPEAFQAKLALLIDRSDAFVGTQTTLTAMVSETKDNWTTVTIRFYDQQGQVVGTCAHTLSCSVPLTVTGPVGTQTFTARAFNAYEQAVISAPVTLHVANQ